MLFKLILILIIAPITELMILIKLYQITSLSTTLGIVLATGIVGAYLAKSQGGLILARIRNEINEGRMPGEQLINGLCVLIGGVLLLAPGLITDTLGFILVIPSTREIFKGFIRGKLDAMAQNG